MPTFTKTWEYVVNQVVSAGSSITDRNQRLMLTMKQAMVDALDTRSQANAAIAMSVPCTVVASSNGTVANTSDNWNAQADINWANAGSAHSWIVLRFPDFFGAGQHLHMLIDLIPVSATGLAYIAFSRDGWNNNGTTTNRPTAVSTDVLLVKDGSSGVGNVWASDSWAGHNTTNNQAVLHYAIADDGSAIKCVICQGGVTSAVWSVWHDVSGPTRAAASDPYSVFYCSSSATTEAFTEANVDDAAGVFSLDAAGASTAQHFGKVVFSSANTSMVDNNISSYDSSRVPVPVFICAASPQGVLDVAPDLWWGYSGDATGDPFPITGTRDTVCIGDFIMPFPDDVVMQAA